MSIRHLLNMVIIPHLQISIGNIDGRVVLIASSISRIRSNSAGDRMTNQFMQEDAGRSRSQWQSAIA
ncbi:hypothetical protein [Stenotrophomonas sp. GZD-301]|uniref:hypothetical protein n=1 Tax=Stenotrophomonas sp. GZD-301 TaxID=3404814 RepID=UPI003BB6AC32